MLTVWLSHALHWFVAYGWFIVGIVPVAVTVKKRTYSVMGNKRVEEVLCDVGAALPQYAARSMKSIESVTIEGPNTSPIGCTIGAGLPYFTDNNGVNIQAGGATTDVYIKVVGI